MARSLLALLLPIVRGLDVEISFDSAYSDHMILQQAPSRAHVSGKLRVGKHVLMHNKMVLALRSGDEEVWNVTATIAHEVSTGNGTEHAFSALLPPVSGGPRRYALVASLIEGSRRDDAMLQVLFLILGFYFPSKILLVKARVPLVEKN